MRSPLSLWAMFLEHIFLSSFVWKPSVLQTPKALWNVTQILARGTSGGFFFKCGLPPWIIICVCSCSVLGVLSPLRECYDLCFTADQIPQCVLGLGLQGLANLIWDSHQPFPLCTRFVPMGAMIRSFDISSMNGQTLFYTFPSEHTEFKLRHWRVSEYSFFLNHYFHISGTAVSIGKSKALCEITFADLSEGYFNNASQ